MFSHIMLGADDIAASKAFYDATFAAIGVGPGFADDKGRVFWMTPTGIFASATLPMRRRRMAMTSSPTCLHMSRNCPPCTPLIAKRRRISFCQLTLHGGNARPF